MVVPTKTSESAASLVAQVVVAVKLLGVAKMEERLTGVFSTVTLSLAEAVTPTVFVTVALMVCEPSETPVLFQVVVYGADVMAEPKLVLSIWNCTLWMPTLSDAVAVSVTEEPETVAPLAGAVSETDGGVVSLDPPPLLLPPPPGIQL